MDFDFKGAQAYRPIAFAIGSGDGAEKDESEKTS